MLKYYDYKATAYSKEEFYEKQIKLLRVAGVKRSLPLCSSSLYSEGGTATMKQKLVTDVIHYANERGNGNLSKTLIEI